MKSYTDLEQSKVLSKILPLESADMWYQYTGISIKDGSKKPIYFPMVIRDCESDEDIPCWSLAALLGVLPNGIVMNKDSQNGRYHFSSKYIGTYVTADNPIDACYEMIIKLKELNLL